MMLMETKWKMLKFSKVVILKGLLFTLLKFYSFLFDLSVLNLI